MAKITKSLIQKIIIICITAFLLMLVISYTFSFQRFYFTFLFSSIAATIAGLLLGNKIINSNLVTSLIIIIPEIIAYFTLNDSWFIVVNNIIIFTGFYLGLNWRNMESVKSRNLFRNLAIIWFFLTTMFSFFISPRLFFYQNYHAYKANFPKKNISLIPSATLGVPIESMNNKVILLDLWNTRCGFCIKQFPETENLFYDFKENNNVLVCGINTGVDTYSKMENYLQKSRLNFPNFYDKDNKLLKGIKYQGYPQTIIVDKKGIIRGSYIGFSYDANLVYNKEMKKLVSEIINNDN